MDPGRQHRWGEWSDWIWDQNQGRYWRARQDTQGNFQYDYGDPNAPQPAAPRSNIDDLAQSFNNVNLGSQDAQYTQDNAYVYGAPVAAGTSAAESIYSAPSVRAHAASSAKGKGKSIDRSAKPKSRGHREPKSTSSKSHRSKPERSFADDYPEDSDDHPPFYRRSDVPAGLDYASVPSANFTPDQTHFEQGHDASPHGPAYVSGPSHRSDAGRRYDQAASSHHDAETEAGTEVEAESVGPEQHVDHGYNPGRETEDPPTEEHAPDYYPAAGSVAQGEPSGQLQDVLSLADAYLTGAPGAPFEEGESSSMASTHSYPYPYEADDGRQTPRPFVQQSAPTTAPDEYAYQVDTTQVPSPGRGLGIHDGYVVEPSSKFCPGEVFKILWCEPMGAGAASKSEVITHRMRVEHNGQQFYQGLRRFIVIANDEGHCTCVPILTYERQACKKKGVKPLKHGIVYQLGKRARMLEREPDLGFSPIRVDLYERTEQLVKESRVNYAKLTTVEHNFRVFFIGRVVHEDFVNIVMPAVDYCWERKRRHNY